MAEFCRPKGLVPGAALLIPARSELGPLNVLAVAGMEESVMSEQENDSDNSEQSPASAVSHQLAKRVATKLADLQVRKTDILKKMQRLRYLADNLAGRRRTAQQAPAVTEQSSSVEARRPQLGDGKLRRACRIALMETEGAQSSSQLYERIWKRGSVCFEDYRDPRGSLVNELETMVRDGEVLCSHAGQEKLWKLKRD